MCARKVNTHFYKWCWGAIGVFYIGVKSLDGLIEIMAKFHSFRLSIASVEVCRADIVFRICLVVSAEFMSSDS